MKEIDENKTIQNKTVVYIIYFIIDLLLQYKTSTNKTYIAITLRFYSDVR